MQNEHEIVWNNCLRIIQQIIDPRKFDMWFKPLRPVDFKDSTLTLEAPTNFFCEYLEDTYLDILKKTLRRVIGADARLVYQVRPVSVQPPMQCPAAEGVAPVNKAVSVNTYPTGSNPGAFVFPGLKRIQIDPRLNPVYCFNNLVVGECNKIGVTVGESIAAAPGTTSFNPLFLFGGPGLGKTHIAQAIGLAIKENLPDKVVLYVSGNEFKIQYMDAYLRNKLTDFLAFYMKIDVLIVDDIQDLISKGAQGAFFNIFNHLHENGKQLILTSDRAPVDLQNFEERLLSRMKWGMSAQLKTPTFETRMKMLRARAFRDGVQIDDEVLEWLATRIQSNFRELEGVLISLIAHATIEHRPITIDLAKEVTGNLVGEAQNTITINIVQKVVCDYFGITRDALQSKSRKRQIVQARQIAMYMSRSLISNCSLSTIGAELGGKDHATVLHACTTVNDLISTDKSFKQYVNDIEKILVSVR